MKRQQDALVMVEHIEFGRECNHEESGGAAVKSRRNAIKDARDSTRVQKKARDGREAHA